VTILASNTSHSLRTWPPKLSTCRHDVNITKTQHIANLVALQSFFTDDSLGSLTGDTYLNQHLPVELECGPMPNVMVALPNTGGPSVQHRKVWLTPATRCRAVTLPRRETR